MNAKRKVPFTDSRPLGRTPVGSGSSRTRPSKTR